MPSERPVIPERILWRVDEGRAVLFDEEEGSPYLLNRTATRIWEGIHQGKEVETLVRELASAYPAVPTEQIRAETLELLQALWERGLLE